MPLLMKTLRILFAVIAILFCSLPSNAVLKGNNINETVIMLGSELEVFSKYVNTTTSDFVKARSEYYHIMSEFRKELASAKLSLYSQQEQYIFGNAYASEVAKDLCKEFYNSELPIGLWNTTYAHAISRCNQLRRTLTQISPDLLNDKAKTSRLKGLAHLGYVLGNLQGWQDSIRCDIERYNLLKAEVDELQASIEKNYNFILNALLLSPDKQPTHKVFGPEFATHWRACMNTLTEMLTSSDYYGWEFQDKWSAEGLFIIISGIIAFAVGLLLSVFVIYKKLAGRWELVEKHPVIFNIFCGWNAMAITFFIIRTTLTTNPFFASALNLGIEVCLIYILINCSVLLRVKNHQLIPTLLSYTPTVVLSLCVILYRILLVDINVIRITYPAVLLLLIVAQIAVIAQLRKKILPLDCYVSYAATAVLSLCFAMNFFGYYYMSIHIALGWSLFIIGHLVLSCFYNYLGRCERRWLLKDKEAYKKSWRPFTFRFLLKPMAFILVLMACTTQCAHIFNINEWLNEIYNYNFIDYPGIVCLSASKVLNITISAVLVNYVLMLFKYILGVQYKERANVGAMNLAKNVFIIVVWGVFIVVALAYVEVNSIGIIATLGGLAVGVGVALRDTFDCLLCGIILMMGRIKIGDVVEVGNDIRGKVIDIQYRTTLIETDDGAIISVFNTQFFGKEFRNVSYSGKYQRLHLAFKVQKEIDSPKVRKMLAQALIDNVPELAKSPAPKILFNASNRFHVDMIAQVWVPVMDYYEAISNVKETLFNTLKENGLSNMSVDSRVRLIKNIVEPQENDKPQKTEGRQV